MGRNEFVKYRKQTSFGQEVDLLDLADGILLQWYSGFDAALCDATFPSKSCTCDNVPAADYPNVLDSTKDAGGLLVSAWQTYWNISGNFFPSTFPVRCQACGKNVILPDGTRGDLPCASDDEWFVPSTKRSTDGANPKEVVLDHNTKLEAYAHGGYTVKAGDTCYNIADSLCQDDNDWKTVICNGATSCNTLQPGQVLKYDCSGKGTYCNGPTEAPTQIIV